MPDIIRLCRICLTDKGNFLNIMSTGYQDVFEKLTSLPLQSPEKPHEVCLMCYAMLKKCFLLKQTALKSEQILNNYLTDNSEKSLSAEIVRDQKLSASVNLSLSKYVFEDIPPVEPVKSEVDVKVEPEICIDKDCVDDSYVGESYIPTGSDSEDDLPLNKIAKKEDVIDDRHDNNDDFDDDADDDRRFDDSRSAGKEKVEKKRRRNDTGLSNSTVITLTKEEQHQELIDRSKSANYVNSRYKCQLCYKGFTDVRTFDNHTQKHDEKSGSYKCDICHFRYRTEKQLRMHKYTCHVRHYRCDRCQYKSHTVQQAREHEAWHSGHRFSCQPCGLKFNKSTSYLSHVRAAHAARHSCGACGHTFAGARGLLLHVRRTHREPPAEDPSEPAADRYCDSCQIQFHSAYAFKRHLVTNVKHALDIEKSPQCVLCGEQVPASERMKHIRKHARMNETNEKARELNENGDARVMVSCKQCPLSFSSKSKLSTHVTRKHKPYKKYNKRLVCEVCGKECTSNATLRYHQRTHTGERPYACQRCPKRFSNKNQLTLHTRVHTGEKPYHCKICLQSFTQRTTLTRHLAMHNGEKLACDICGKLLSRKDHLDEHKSLFHGREIALKPVHTGIKAHQCQLCSKSFTQSNSLKLHVNTVHLNLQTQRKRKKDSQKKEDSSTV